MLHEAVMSGDATIVRMLLAEGHCCDTLTFMGQTTLFLGAACGSAESLKALLEHPTCTEGTMNRGTPNNITPLELAARAGHVKQTVGRVSCIGGADAGQVVLRAGRGQAELSGASVCFQARVKHNSWALELHLRS